MCCSVTVAISKCGKTSPIASTPNVEHCMATQVSRTAICHDAGDGSGDLIVQIPPEVIDAMGLRYGDKLELELVDGALVLTPIRDGSQDS
jgi:antitoxin ChpS